MTSQRIYSSRKWAVCRSTRPYLWPSPDLLVYCPCCEAGLSEIKCPLSIADEVRSAANLSYLVECDNVTTLKKKSMPIMHKNKGSWLCPKENIAF